MVNPITLDMALRMVNSLLPHAEGDDYDDAIDAKCALEDIKKRISDRPTDSGAGHNPDHPAWETRY